MVARGCGVAKGGEKEGERGAGGGVEMFLGRDDFSPTLHPDFYSFRPWNQPLFIGGKRAIFCL